MTKMKLILVSTSCCLAAWGLVVISAARAATCEDDDPGRLCCDLWMIQGHGPMGGTGTITSTTYRGLLELHDRDALRNRESCAQGDKTFCFVAYDPPACVGGAASARRPGAATPGFSPAPPAYSYRPAPFQAPGTFSNPFAPNPNPPASVPAPVGMRRCQPGERPAYTQFMANNVSYLWCRG